MSKPKQFTYQTLRTSLRKSSESKTIANNTIAESWGDEHIVIRYHGNRIAVLSENSIQLFHAGWMTSTTKDRLNWFIQHTPYSVYQKDFIWYLWNRNTGSKIEFEDGVTLKLSNNEWKVDELPF